MKKTSLIIALLLTTFFFISCSKDDDSNSTISVNDVNTTVAAGSWRITYYYDTDHEETSNYSGYSFVFGTGNVITATKASAVVTGSWTTGTDNSTVKLVLLFTIPAAFAELSDDWHVVERTATKIRLQHVSGGNGGTDYLTFEKN
jgi:hypothetical protein